MRFRVKQKLSTQTKTKILIPLTEYDIFIPTSYFPITVHNYNHIYISYTPKYVKRFKLPL